MELAEPTTLVKLPRPGLVQDARTYFSQVYGIHAGVKRKREEICACVDGNSVNIYEATTGRNVFSVAVPPDTRFLGAPSSSRIRTDTNPPCRLTCCVTERRNRVCLTRYAETAKRGQITTAVSEIALQTHHGKVCCVQIVDSDETVVLGEDGRGVTVLSSPSSVQEFRLSTPYPSSRFIRAQIIKIKDAQSSILKSRPDLVSKAFDARHLIVAASTHLDNKSKGRRRIQLGIWPVYNTLPASPENVVQPILQHAFSDTFDPTSHISIAFDDTASTLSMSTSAASLAYDLTPVHPRKLYELQAAGQVDTIRLSPHLQIRATAENLELVNTTYNSILSTTVASLKSKRKRDGGSFAVQSFIAYVSRQKRVLAFSTASQTILSIDVLAGDAGMQQVSSLLANLGRGDAKRHKTSRVPMMDCSIGLIVNSGESDAGLLASRESLDGYVAAGDGSSFEATFIERVMNNDMENMRTLADATLDFLLVALFRFDHDVTDPSWVRPCSCPIRLRMKCPRLFAWCANKGYLTNTRLHNALQNSPQSSSPWFPQSAIGTALIQDDASLYLVSMYLKLAPHLDPESLGTLLFQLLHCLIQDLNSITQQITNGPTDTNSASKDLVKLGSDERTPSTPVTHTLVRVLQRLSSTGQENTCRQISRVLNQAEVLTLIQFLRQQLFQGGYTRSSESHAYPSPPSSHDGALTDSEWWTERSELSLGAVITLLNGSIDAIGPAGLLGSAGQEEFVQSLLPDLRSEVSLACQAVEEAAFLNGIMRESLRYTESYERRHDEGADNEGKPQQKRRTGEILTIYTEPMAGDAADMPKSALPLSLQAEGEIDSIKVRKGGGQTSHRSGREIAMLKDRARADYTLERLIL